MSGVGGDGATPERARAQPAASRSARAVAPSFDRRWFCHATGACIRAGALPGRTCPRDAGHRTHTELCLDLREGAAA